MPDTVEESKVVLIDLESAILSIAQTVEIMGKQIEAQGDQLQNLVQRNARPPSLPRAQSPRDRIRSMTKGETLTGQERRDPSGLKAKFQSDDVVRLVHENKITSLLQAGKVQADEPISGVVQSQMYRRRRDNMPKYRVTFPAYGDDGIMEDEMVLVEDG